MLPSFWEDFLGLSLEGCKSISRFSADIRYIYGRFLRGVSPKCSVLETLDDISRIGIKYGRSFFKFESLMMGAAVSPAKRFIVW